MKPKLTPEVIEQITYFAERGYANTTICGLIGVSEVSFYDWIKKGEALKEGLIKEDEVTNATNLVKLAKSFRAAKAKFQAVMQDSILSMATVPDKTGKANFQAAKYYLQLQNKEVFNENPTKTDTSISISGGEEGEKLEIHVKFVNSKGEDIKEEDIT